MILQKLRIPQHSNDGSTQGETSSRSQKDVDTSHYNYFDSVQTPIDRVHESTSYVDPSYTAIDQSKNNSPLSPIITPQLDSRIASTDCGSRHNSNFCIILPPDSAHFPHPGDRVSSVASPKRTHVVFWPKKERNLSIGDSQMDIQTTERETHTGEAIDTSLAATRAFCWAVEFVLWFVQILHAGNVYLFSVVVITLLARSLHLTQETYIPYERLPAVMALIAGVIGSIAATCKSVFLAGSHKEVFFFIQPSFFTGSALEKLYLFRRFLEGTALYEVEID
ncbi:hypothetical protein NEOLI_003233 [Neolecta irregularis DAH-3]|uniref:Uncharacterized protein n=1 Tax=Neolecta irregularis (strain DAH-3) TaxID=1198029 RepID=A0A1U7LKC4_NEOID|nr:hypothetical protein NEOLI_003233 [Neolecta irregularis DAH-3]|eukprot:OLL23104.1 hypothetical protein NEOLI_003233 [Neolecta irregularis DAH-3]